MEGASGEEGKFAAMPKPPSGREVARRKPWRKEFFGSSYSINKRGLLRQKGTFHAYPDL